MVVANLVKLLEDNKLFKQQLVLKRNEFLSHNDQINTDVYFIEEGSLRLFVLNNSEEQIIRFGYKNNIVTALDSFLTNKSSDFYIQAIRKTSLKVIAKQDLLFFFNSNTELLKVWIAILEDLVLQQIEREKDLLIISPKERYQRVLKRSPQLFQEIPNKYIANYLRMKPETLSRLKKS